MAYIVQQFELWMEDQNASAKTKKVIQNVAYAALKLQKSPGKKSTKSPTKSPNKKSRSNDENASPTK